MNAVIYARYSSHNQTEQSIEGQLADAHEYAKRNDITIVGEYIDRALTGTKDQRPDFQRMIKDAEKHQFQLIIVWKLDRFARNRYDSAFYKAKLKKHGVRVVSVMESIPESPEGIILEGLLESMAEYYSANLSENIKRGQQESVKKGWYCGGSVPMGYKLQDHKLIEDERTAPIIRELYSRYASGEPLTNIAADFNARGIHTQRGNRFTIATFDRMIPNASYIGEYTYKGQTVPGLCQPIIDQETFAQCVKRRNANRHAPAARRSKEVFALQGKAFCGLCGSPMCGDTGTSKSGAKHLYYSCTAKKHHKNNCTKKSEKRDFLEYYVCEQAVKYVLDPARLDSISKAVADAYNSDIDTSNIKVLERKIKRLNGELNTLIDRLITVPESAVKRITERMEAIETQRTEAEAELAKLRIESKIKITKEKVSAWLKTFADGDLKQDAFRQKIIDIFVNSVYLYNDKLILLFNVHRGQETATIDPEEANKKSPDNGSCSPLSGTGGALPDKVEHSHQYLFLSSVFGVIIKR